MKDKIKENINNPGQLERLFHDDRKLFESSFDEVYPEIAGFDLAKYWRIRLDFDKTPDNVKKSSLTDILVMIAVCLISGFLIKIPDIFKINPSEVIFYEKNAGIIVFGGLTLYIIWKNRIFDLKRLTGISAALLVLTIYINLLPSVRESSSINLVCIHLPLLLWCIFGLVFIDLDFKNKSRRMEYIRFNGDLAILTALILISGGILAVVTIGLFEAIGINVEKFYMRNIAIIGMVSVPVVATYIIKNYTAITNKIAPVIASIFSPLVLITAIIYLISIAISGKNPYNDRSFLLVFNLMLLGVMAIIVFSVSETSVNRKQKFNEIVLFFLSILTIIIDLIALSAIFYRIGTYGITPNRLAVLGSNTLIFINLILIMIDLYKINFKKEVIDKVGVTISTYLPVYVIWILFVIFGFPFIFGMK